MKYIVVWACTLMPVDTPIEHQYDWKPMCGTMRYPYEATNDFLCQPEVDKRVDRLSQTGWLVYGAKCVGASNG